MPIFRFAFVSLLCGFVLPQAVALAWNGTGHEIVAEIAWDQLTPAERAGFVDVLKGHPRYAKDLEAYFRPGEDPAQHVFLEAATWPDSVRNPMNPLSRTEHHPEWHYADFPYNRDGRTGPEPAVAWDGHDQPTNALQALAMATSQLRDPATPADRRAIDLCWVLHLVGDIHQPMHAVSLFSNSYPDGDRGGNLTVVSTPDNPSTNLHAVWDGIEGRSYDPAVIRKSADRIEHDHPRASLTASLAATRPVDWAHESFEAAKSIAYQDGKIAGVTKDQAATRPASVPPLPIGYEQRARETADTRIALAGYRLAELLKSLPHL